MNESVAELARHATPHTLSENGDPSDPAAASCTCRDARSETSRTGKHSRGTVRARVAVIVGLALVVTGIGALCLVYGPELFAFFADAQRFRSWVDEHALASRIAFVTANVAQIVLAFLPGEPLELAAGYAFGFWEGTLLCLLASALGTALVMMLVRRFGMRMVALFFSPDKITSLRWLQNTRRFELVMFLVFLVPGTPKDLLTYVAGLGKSSIPRIVALTTLGRIPSIVSSTLTAGAFGDGNYAVAAVVAAVTIALATAGVIIYRHVTARESTRALPARAQREGGHRPQPRNDDAQLAAQTHTHDDGAYVAAQGQARGEIPYITA